MRHVAFSSHIVITPSDGFAHLPLRELWQQRELIYFFIWRDVKVRYKQTLLGLLWTVIRPLISMGVFTFVFSTLGHFPSQGTPYPLLTLAGIVVWTMVSDGISGSTQSLLANPNLITKVYFPRLVLPLSAAFRTLVDLGITLILYILASLAFSFPPTISLAILPLAVLFAMMSMLGLGLWLSAVSVRYRDVALALPFLLQLLFWISPVGYSSANVPVSVEPLYWMNPLVGVIELFRYCLLGDAHLSYMLLSLSVAMNCILLGSGLWYFQRVENEFADVI